MFQHNKSSMATKTVIRDFGCMCRLVLAFAAFVALPMSVHAGTLLDEYAGTPDTSKVSKMTVTAPNRPGQSQILTNSDDIQTMIRSTELFASIAIELAKQRINDNGNTNGKWFKSKETVVNIKEVSEDGEEILVIESRVVKKSGLSVSQTKIFKKNRLLKMQGGVSLRVSDPMLDKSLEELAKGYPKPYAAVYSYKFD